MASAEHQVECIFKAITSLSPSKGCCASYDILQKKVLDFFQCILKFHKTNKESPVMCHAVVGK